MNINPPHCKTPTRRAKLFFPLVLRFCQRCLAASLGRFNREQYHCNGVMGTLLNSLGRISTRMLKKAMQALSEAMSHSPILP